MEILEGIFVKNDQKWGKKNPTYANICGTLILIWPSQGTYFWPQVSILSMIRPKIIYYENKSFSVMLLYIN